MLSPFIFCLILFLLYLFIYFSLHIFFHCVLVPFFNYSPLALFYSQSNLFFLICFCSLIIHIFIRSLI